MPQLSKQTTPKTASININDLRFLRNVPNKTIENSPAEGMMKESRARSFDDREVGSSRSCDTPLDKAAGEKAHR